MVTYCSGVLPIAVNTHVAVGVRSQESGGKQTTSNHTHSLTHSLTHYFVVTQWQSDTVTQWRSDTVSDVIQWVIQWRSEAVTQWSSEVVK
jgi:hypothetical protein